MSWPAAPSDPPARQARVPGGTAAWTEEGDGPVVVAIHGIPGSGRDFRWLAPALTGVRLLRLDLPGFGATPAATAPARAAAMVAHMRATLDAAGVGACVLLAHSFGAGLAARVAAVEPDRVAGLALLAPAGLHPHALLRHQRTFRVLGHLAATPGLGRVVGPPLVPLYRQAGFQRTTPPEIRRNIAIVGRYDWGRTAAVVRDLGARGLPALVAWTEDDAILEPARAREWVAALDARPLPFPTGGHSLQKTRADEIAAVLGPWVGAVLGG